MGPAVRWRGLRLWDRAQRLPRRGCAADPGRAGALPSRGEGRNAVWLAGRGHEVTAVDASPVGIAKAEALARARGVKIATVAADLADYTIEPGRWAGIVAIFAHLPPALRRAVHRAAAAGIAPGGVFVLEAFTPAQMAYGTGGPSQPELLYELADLRDDLADLEIVIGRELEREILEGVYHTGRSAVVQVLARRTGFGVMTKAKAGQSKAPPG